MRMPLKNLVESGEFYPQMSQEPPHRVGFEESRIRATFHDTGRLTIRMKDKHTGSFST